MRARRILESPYEIVVPTDFSPNSTRGMQFAMALAGPRTRVTAVHGLDQFPYKFGPEESSNLRRQQAWATAQDSIARWMREGKFCKAETVVLEGEPAPAVAEFASSKGADLVVLGTSARSHAGRILLGSVAEEIFREIKCPVVVVGPRVRLRTRRQIARLVFATDLEPHSLAALSQLSKLRSKFHSNLAAIRAVPRHLSLPGEQNRLKKETRDTLYAAADPNLRRHTKKISVVFAPPAKAIPTFAKRLHADAIVMGIRRGGELSRAVTHIPWTLAHRVIAEATCPVITIRG
jgi:nucleotide-binding universal stress UspA family protein